MRTTAAVKHSKEDFMKRMTKKRMSTETLVLGAILTALVIILQYLGQFIRLGPFSISLVLVPIVVGSAMCGTKVSTWLGFVFGIIVLMTDATAFLAVSVAGTVITVLVKGAACGFAAGLVYKLLKKFNLTVAAIVSAIVCPIVNTGVFLLGSAIFFLPSADQIAAKIGLGVSGMAVFWALAMANFIFEISASIVLSPVIVRLLEIRKKQK